MRTRILFLIAALTGCTQAFAQLEGTQYFMNSIQQYNGNNPAFIPRYKFSLGLPGISMLSATYTNNGFTYNDVVKVENGKRFAMLDRLVKALPPKTYINGTFQTDLLRLGIRLGSNAYLSLNSTGRIYSRLMIPKDVLSFVAEGNESYVGKTASISPAGEAMVYWENAVGLALTPVENLTVGVKAKYLRGFMNVHTASADATVSVAENYNATIAADLKVQTSGIEDNNDSFSLSNYSRNSGLAFDIGATYKMFDKLTLAASLVDIGAIKWKDNNYQYSLDKSKAVYTFEGVDLNEMLEGNDGYIDELVDSLKAHFTPEEKAGEAYSTMLPAKMYMSATYEVMKNFNVGGAFYGERFMGRTTTGVTLSANKHFGKIMSGTLSYTMTNRSFNNLGAGMSLNFTPLQIYVVGDNLLRLPLSVAANKGDLNGFINSTQVFNIRFGINLVVGWTNEAGKKVEDKSFNSKKKATKTSSDKGKHPTPSHINVRKKKR